MILPWKAAIMGVFEDILVLAVGIVLVEATKLRRAILSKIRRVTLIIGPYLWKLI